MLYEVITELSKAKKQLEAFMTFFTLIGGAHPSNFDKSIDKNILKDKCNISLSTINELVKKGILVETDEVVSRLNRADKPVNELKELTPAQQAAMDKINSYFIEKDAVLLHGVTSSGKTRNNFV